MLEKEYWYAVLNQSAKKAGVEASIDVYHTDIHAFDMLRPRLPESQEAIRKFEKEPDLAGCFPHLLGIASQP